MTDIVKLTSERLGGVTTPRMEGDNLAVLLCSVFENPDQEVDEETGWTLDAVTGCNEVLDAIREHYRPLADTIEQLRARIAELEGAIGELVLEVKGWQDSAAKALAATNKALAELQRRNDETAAAIRERTDGR